MNPETAETSQDVIATSRHEAESLEAPNQLERVNRDQEAEGVIVETAIREGQPAEEILAEVAGKQVDLIVLTAYGLGGAHVLRPNAVFGSVADSVLRGSRVPVLVIHP
jgi:nucleotide-binding universal stress UspA family protein